MSLVLSESRLLPSAACAELVVAVTQRQVEEMEAVLALEARVKAAVQLVAHGGHALYHALCGLHDGDSEAAAALRPYAAWALGAFCQHATGAWSERVALWCGVGWLLGSPVHQTRGWMGVEGCGFLWMGGADAVGTRLPVLQQLVLLAPRRAQDTFQPTPCVRMAMPPPAPSTTALSRCLLPPTLPQTPPP